MLDIGMGAVVALWTISRAVICLAIKDECQLSQSYKKPCIKFLDYLKFM